MAKNFVDESINIGDANYAISVYITHEITHVIGNKTYNVVNDDVDVSNIYFSVLVNIS